MDSPATRFSLRQLLIAISLIALGLVGNTWIFASTQLQFHQWLPFFSPPRSILYLSDVAPYLAIAAIGCMLFWWATCRPLPLTPFLFATCLPVMLIAPRAAAVRILTVLIIGAMCIIGETAVRRLPRSGYLIALCFVVVAACFYMVTTSVFHGHRGAISPIGFAAWVYCLTLVAIGAWNCFSNSDHSRFEQLHP